MKRNETANTTEFDEIRRVLTQEPCAFLIGSAVSIFPPTGIPAGGAIAQDIVDVLLDGQAWDDAEELRIARRFALGCAFESLLEAYPKIASLKAFFAAAMAAKSPNPVHAAIAATAGAGQAPIVTTNYDDLIEQACAAARIPFATVVNDDDRAQVANGELPIFKIHGCVRQPQTLVVKMSEEPVANTWKSAYLADLIRGRNLFVIGYSGQDFDICPTLTQVGAARIFWSVRDFDADRPYFSQHFQSLMGSGRLGDDLVVVSGDLQELLGLRPQRPMASSFSFSAFVGQDLTPAEAALWRANFFATLGLEPAVRRLFPLLDREEVVRLTAVCDFMRGYHRKAFEDFSLPRISPAEERLLKSIRLRNSGRLRLARLHLEVFAASWRRYPLPLKRKTVRSLRYALLLNRYVPASPPWRRQARHLLRSALAAGAWSEVNQLLAILQHAGVDQADLGFYWDLLPPQAGSTQIGGAFSHVHEFARAAFRRDDDYAAFAPVIALAERFNYNSGLMLLYDAALCSTGVVGFRRRIGLLWKLIQAYRAGELTGFTKLIYAAKAVGFFLRLSRHIPV